MEDRLEKKLQKVISARAARYGISEADVRSLARKPRFLIAAEKRASERGISIESLLAEELELMRSSNYPGPDCLLPYEVEIALVGELDADRMRHVEECDPCRAMLGAAKPTKEGEEALMEDLRQLIPAKAIAGRRS